MLFFVLLFVSACYFVVFLFFSRPASAEFSAPGVLIVAAHSDDCVIMGAEMAWGIIREGGCVRITYLTCSGPTPASPISRKRSEEAKSAWRIFGSDRVEFREIGLPESPVSGPQNYGRPELDRAVEALEQELLAMPSRSIVLIPAARESHVDHRSARHVAIQALDATGRSDLQPIETTEYNSLISMRQDPITVLFLILAQFPFIGRLLPKRVVAPPFWLGHPGVVFRDDCERFTTKLAMFDSFVSQDPDLLRRFFSWRSRYRCYQREKRGAGVKLFGCTADVTVTVFIGLLALTSFFFGWFLRSFDGVAHAAGLIGVVAVFFSVIKRRMVVGFLAAFLILGVTLAGAL